MRRAFALLIGLAALLTVCSQYRVGEPTRIARARDNGADIGTYAVDPEDGAITASNIDGSGVATILRSGKTVPAVLPLPFRLYPEAQVLHTTSVEQGEGRYITVDFITPDDRATVLGFYRQQAARAGIDTQIDVPGDVITTIGGRSADGSSHFSLRAADKDEQTLASLTIVTGFE